MLRKYIVNATPKWAKVADIAGKNFPVQAKDSTQAISICRAIVREAGVYKEEGTILYKARLARKGE